VTMAPLVPKLYELSSECFCVLLITECLTIIIIRSYDVMASFLLFVVECHCIIVCGVLKPMGLLCDSVRLEVFYSVMMPSTSLSVVVFFQCTFVSLEGPTLFLSRTIHNAFDCL